MTSATLKSLMLSVTPGFLKPHWARLEASPLGYRLAKGAFWSLVGALISRGLGLISTIIVGRMLNPHGFGELAMVQSTVGLFGTVAGFGLGMSSNKFVAEFRRSDPARAGRIIALSSITAWMSSGVIGILLLCLAPWVSNSLLSAPQLAPLLRIGSLLLLLSGVNGAQTGALSGFEAFKTISKINLYAGLITFPFMMIGVWLAGVKGALWAMIASTALNCILNFAATRAEAKANRVPLAYHGCSREWSIFLQFNLPGVLNSVLLSFSGWACSAMLVHQVDGYSGMGVFNAVKRVQQVPEILLGMLMAPLLPVLSEAFGRKDLRTYGNTLSTAFSVAVVLMVPFSLAQISAPWLTLLPYGERYRDGENVVRWVMLGSAAYGLLWPLGAVIISLGKMWLAFWLILLNTGTFLGLGYFLIPRYGAAGYAAASACSFILGNTPCAFFLYRRLGPVMREVGWNYMTLTTFFLIPLCWCGSMLCGQRLSSLIGLSTATFFVVWRMLLIMRTFTPIVPLQFKTFK